MTAMRIYNATIEAGCDGIVDKLEDGAGAALVRIYTGAQPAINAAASGAILAEFTMSDPAFGAAAASGAGAVATALSMPKTDAAAEGTGTAGYGAVLDSDANILWTGDVATSGADFNIDNTSITTGQEVQLTSFTFTLPQD